SSFSVASVSAPVRRMRNCSSCFDSSSSTKGRSSVAPFSMGRRYCERPRELRLCLEDEVHRGLARPAEVREARFLEHLAQTRFTGLCAQAETDLLRQRVRRA